MHPSAQDIKVAVDAVIATVQNGVCKVLLIQMKKAPYEGLWAIPGGLLNDGEQCSDAARRILVEQTGLTDAYLEQLATFDDPKRDPFGRVVSVAYFALASTDGTELIPGVKYADVRWWSVKKLPKLAYDHSAMLTAALARIRSKLEYTNVAWSLLPKVFTLAELQTVYEAILGRTVDRRNFRKKVLSTGLVVATGKKKAEGAHRPAELFAFKKRRLTYVEML